MSTLILTDLKWWALCDAHGDRPMSLDAKSARLKSFVYDRKFGVFPCPFGAHPGLMSLLLAWHHGYNNGIDIAEKLGLEYSRGTADRYLERVGTAFRSSQSNRVEAFSRRNLEDWELALLGEVRFIGEPVGSDFNHD